MSFIDGIELSAYERGVQEGLAASQREVQRLKSALKRSVPLLKEHICPVFNCRKCGLVDEIEALALTEGAASPQACRHCQGHCCDPCPVHGYAAIEFYTTDGVPSRYICGTCGDQGRGEFADRVTCSKCNGTGKLPVAACPQPSGITGELDLPAAVASPPPGAREDR